MYPLYSKTLKAPGEHNSVHDDFKELFFLCSLNRPSALKNYFFFAKGMNQRLKALSHKDLSERTEH